MIKARWQTVSGMRFRGPDCQLLFSLLIGVTADKIGFNPLFIAMGFFDLIGFHLPVAFIAERRAKRALSGCKDENAETLDIAPTVGSSR